MITRLIYYAIALILFGGWALGLLAFGAGNLIYILLVLAIIAFLLGTLQQREYLREPEQDEEGEDPREYNC